MTFVIDAITLLQCSVQWPSYVRLHGTMGKAFDQISSGGIYINMLMHTYVPPNAPGSSRHHVVFQCPFIDQKHIYSLTQSPKKTISKSYLTPAD